MDVYFDTEELQNACNSAKVGDRRWGDQAARRIRNRLAQLQAAGTLEDMRQFGGANPHELKGDRHGQIAVNGKGAMRIIFVPVLAEKSIRAPSCGSRIGVVEAA